MPTDRFDHLTTSLIAGRNRRWLLRLLLLAGGLGTFHPTKAMAKKGKRKKGCKPPCGLCATCAKGRCTPKPAGTSCGTDQICQGAVCLVPECGAGGPCRVFLSSVLYDGDLNGLSGADAKCQGLATAVGFPGTYKAWLSDETGSPFARFMRSSGPYRLVNGTTIAANWTDLTDGHLAAPISVTETGGGAISNAWTHTRTDGTRDGALDEHCSNWSMNAGAGDDGDPEQSDPDWTGWLLSSCAFHRHLYCFQQS